MGQSTAADRKRWSTLEKIQYRFRVTETAEETQLTDGKPTVSYG